MSQLNKKSGLLRSKAPVLYPLNKTIRGLAMKAMRLIADEAMELRNGLHNEQIQKILLVRATFRMGSSVLATPATFLFRRSFPHAKIDFVGPPISKSLFKNLPIDHHFSITRRFPNMLWAYFALLNKIRSAGYALAMDVSCSQSATDSFIVEFSGARFRVGTKGKWDHWFNMTIPRPPEVNKYQVLPAFLRSLGIETPKIFPRLLLSPEEKSDFKRWGTPENMAQIVYEPGGVSAEEVLEISLAELCCKNNT